MVKGTTKSGFSFELDDDVTDNMELIDALADLDKGDTLAMSTVCDLVLGDSKKDLYDHLRNEHGRVLISDVSKELMEIIEFFGKKS